MNLYSKVTHCGNVKIDVDDALFSEPKKACYNFMEVDIVRRNRESLSNVCMYVQCILFRMKHIMGLSK